MNQPPRVQLSLDQYHDLVTFQSFSLMQAQLAMATKDAQIAMLAQQLAEAKAPAPAPEQAAGSAA